MPSHALIDVHDVRYTYTSATSPAVDALSFTVERGEIFGFLGPSGAGKSTMQKILIRLLRDFFGAITIFDRPLHQWNGDYYERIGVSFEFPNHYLKLSGVENLRYFGALYRDGGQKPEALLKMVGLEDDGEMLVSRYSKGMKNRLSVARSLLHNPELLFWDEPTAGLDPGNARRIKAIAQAQRDAGHTIFLSTHDMTVADELCDRVAFIADGKIRLIDSPRNLKLRYGQERVRVEFTADGQTEQCDFPLAGLGDNPDFLRTLREKEVQTIHTLEASLEDIFIQVTGQALR